jgi:5-methylcytosine-specific restriction endonuclease McrA
MSIKLSNLKPSFGSLVPRLGRLPDDEAARYRHRDALKPWRRLYKTARWQRLRMSTFIRDQFTCQLCPRIEADTSQLVADHKTPHRGDERLFWDPDNIQTLCKPCHDSAKQSAERAHAWLASQPM